MENSPIEGQDATFDYGYSPKEEKLGGKVEDEESFEDRWVNRFDMLPDANMDT